MTGVAVHDLLEALSSMGIAIEAHGGSLRYRPVSAMTADLLEAVKSCKAGLLEILQNDSLSCVPGVGGQCAAGARTAPIETLAQTPSVGESRADREWDRFLACAVPTPNGLGWYDPSESPDMPSGADGEAWRRFERDCGRTGKAARL